MEEHHDLTNIKYLDNAATTYPKPKEIIEKAAAYFLGYGVNPGRSGYDLCMVTGELVHETRRELAEFFGGDDPNRLVFAYNASDALNILIQGVLREGDHAITTTIEHNSVIRPMNHMRDERGVEVDFVPVGGDCRVDPADIAARIKPNTKLVVVNHGSNVVGVIQPVAEVGAVCKEHGVCFAIDAAQTAGVLPINIKEMNIDAVAFTGHKSLLAPSGIGGLYVGENVDIRSTRYGGTGVRSAHPHHLDEFPYRLEVGTANVLGIAGLHYAQEYIAKRGLENIYQHEMDLFRTLQNGIEGTEGITLHGTTSFEHRLPVLSLTVQGRDAADVGMLLDVEYGIASRTGLHCAPLIHKQLGTGERGTVRLSIGPMNKAEEIATAIEAVKEIAADALT